MDASAWTDDDTAVSVRAQMVDAAIELVRVEGAHALHAERLAEQVQHAPDEVFREFPSRHGLVAATITRWYEHQIGPAVSIASSFGAVAFLHAVLVGNRKDPHLVRLLVSTLASASDPAHPVSPYYRQQHSAFRRTVRDFLTADVARGREPATMDPRAASQQLVALYEGLLLQGVLHDDLDTVSAFDRAASRLRRGWSEPYRCADHYASETDL
ncbi:MAG: TetR family transcriptional regulator C-terminal domain-containing protein [Williamsia herbipolensis]|nr:TetR family transcriptional regulator C-terminal domain-containing protein [Williamsia herbipolensis]